MRVGTPSSLAGASRAIPQAVCPVTHKRGRASPGDARRFSAWPATPMLGQRPCSLQLSPPNGDGNRAICWHSLWKPWCTALHRASPGHPTAQHAHQVLPSPKTVSTLRETGFGEKGSHNRGADQGRVTERGKLTTSWWVAFSTLVPFTWRDSN